jgi:hypothetical protein
MVGRTVFLQYRRDRYGVNNDRSESAACHRVSCTLVPSFDSTGGVEYRYTVTTDPIRVRSDGEPGKDVRPEL